MSWPWSKEALQSRGGLLDHIFLKFFFPFAPGHSTPDAASLPSPTTLSPSSAVGRGDEEEERRRRKKQQDGGGGRVKDIRGMFEKDFNPLPEYGSVSPARSVSPAPPPAEKENEKKGKSDETRFRLLFDILLLLIFAPSICTYLGMIFFKKKLFYIHFILG